MVNGRRAFKPSLARTDTLYNSETRTASHTHTRSRQCRQTSARSALHPHVGPALGPGAPYRVSSARLPPQASSRASTAPTWGGCDRTLGPPGSPVPSCQSGRAATCVRGSRATCFRTASVTSGRPRTRSGRTVAGSGALEHVRRTLYLPSSSAVASLKLYRLFR